MKEEIVGEALTLTKEGGITARAVGGKLGSSSKVIFGIWGNMEE